MLFIGLETKLSAAAIAFTNILMKSPGIVSKPGGISDALHLNAVNIICVF